MNSLQSIFHGKTIIVKTKTTNSDQSPKAVSHPSKTLIFFILSLFFVVFILLAKSAYDARQVNNLATETETLSLPELVDTETTTTPIETEINAENQTPLWQTLTINPGDSLSTLLTRANVLQTDIRAILEVRLYNKYLKKLRPGQNIKIQTQSNNAEQNNLIAYTQDIENHKMLNIRKQSDGRYQASMRTHR